jgi:hypothetical protein
MVKLKKLTHTLLAILCFLASGLFLYAFVWTCTEPSLFIPFVRVLSASSFTLSVLTLLYLVTALLDHDVLLRAS